MFLFLLGGQRILHPTTDPLLHPLQLSMFQLWLSYSVVMQSILFSGPSRALEGSGDALWLQVEAFGFPLVSHRSHTVALLQVKTADGVVFYWLRCRFAAATILQTFICWNGVSSDFSLLLTGKTKQKKGSRRSVTLCLEMLYSAETCCIYRKTA